MSQTLLSSKVEIQEEEPQIRQIAGVPTAITGFVGVTEKGPIGVAVVVQSPAEFRRYYGGYIANGDVACAVDGFFQNGGKQAYISRVVHMSDPANTATKTSAKGTQTLLTGPTAATSGYSEASLAGPYTLTAGATLIVSVDGGGTSTATFTAVAAVRESGAGGPFVLTNGMTLLVAIDGGAVQTITFATANFVSIGAATAAEIAAVINGVLVGGKATVTSTTKVSITSDKMGTASGVNVSGGTANAVMTYTTGNVAGTGNVANILAVTNAEVITVVGGAVAGCTVTTTGASKSRITSNTTGSSSSVLVTAPSTADTLMGFDNATHAGLSGAAVNTLQVDGKYDGTYTNALSTKVADASSGEAGRFNLQILKAGVVLETWPNLSMDDNDPLYIETVLNNVNTGSDFLTATDLDAVATSAAGQRPVNGTFTFASGADGLGSLADADFIGSVGTTRSGIRCFDLIPDMSILTVPGRATSAVHNAMLAYCETQRNGAMFAVLDPPAASSASAMVSYVTTTAAILNFSEFGAIYWPRINVVNPNKTVFGNGDQITVPPSGHIAGVCARNDAARDGGVYDAPAGTEQGVLQGVLGFETDECLDEDKRDLVYPQRINPLTTGPGLPRFIDGSRTLKGTGNFPSVSERRGVIFIEQSIKTGLQFARHKNNDEVLRARVDRTVGDFLTVQMKNRAFRSQDPKTAFFKDFGDGLNSVSQQFAGKLIGRVGLATQKPAEFIIIRFSQDTRAFTEAQA